MTRRCVREEDARARHNGLMRVRAYVASLFAAVIVVSGVTSAIAQEVIHPERRATRAVSPPVIDGELIDETWQAPPLETGEWLSYNPLHGDRIPQTTTVWFAYDDDYLYFAFKCDDPEPSEIKTSVTR